MRKVTTPQFLLYAAFFGTPTLYHAKRNYRQITAYSCTNTPSLGPKKPTLPSSRSWDACITHYQSSIYYHAQQRSILIFQLFVAFYLTNCFILNDSTRTQHGVGSAKHRLQACHSSLFPRVIDWSIDFSVKNNQFYLRRSSIIDHTQVYQDNNMTVCMPTIVNDVDKFFEGNHGSSIYRKQTLCILNCVSRGEFNPVVGLGYFYQVMNAAFKNQLEFINKEKNSRRKAAIVRVFKIQKAGTFSNAIFKKNNNIVPKKNFINKILNRQKHETEEMMYVRAQQEILSTPYHKRSGRDVRFNNCV